MTRWFFSGIVDAHILVLSNYEHPDTTQYKEMIIDVALRERSIFDRRSYPISKSQRTLLDDFDLPENWSILQTPVTQFLYQAIMGYNNGFHMVGQSLLRCCCKDIFILCNRLSERNGYTPVYTRIPPMKNNNGMTDLDFDIASAFSQKKKFYINRLLIG